MGGDILFFIWTPISVTCDGGGGVHLFSENCTSYPIILKDSNK